MVRVSFRKTPRKAAATTGSSKPNSFTPSASLRAAAAIVGAVITILVLLFSLATLQPHIAPLSEVAAAPAAGIGQTASAVASSVAPPQPPMQSAPAPAAPPAAQASSPPPPSQGPWEDFDDPLWPGYRNQPPPDPWTASLEPPTAASVGETGRTPLAYILTVNTTSVRYRYTAVRAAAAGMRPVPHFGTWPSSDTSRPLGMRKLCATRFAHKTSWRRFVEDPGTGEQDWAFFFEDDVNLRLRGPAAHLAWRRAIAHPDVAARGIVYLGYCGAIQAPNTTEGVLVAEGEATPFGPFPAEVRMNMACGSCQHAYGLRKDFARVFWDMGFLNIPSGDDACNTTHAEARGVGYRVHGEVRGADVVNADTSVIYVCMNQLNGIPNVAFNLKSPQHADHVGLYFQDRGSFSSLLDAGNYGTHSSEGGLKAEPTIEDA